ncbi:MAG TPA: sigma 54-interacting transcriptional regulator [Candidatus Sulfotelmatobacter sp.]
MTRTNSPTGSAGWLRHATASSPFLNRLNIHRRLTLCFIFIIVLMLIGNGVLLWQLHLISAQVERLNGVNEELIEVLRVHTGLLSAYERLGAAARSEDSGRLLKEWETLRAGLAEDAQRTQAAFSHLPPEVNADQTVLPTLESIERALPSHLDAIRALAASGEWEAVRIRIDVQVQPLESLSSELVKDVAREVEEQRAQATLNISRAERRIFLAVPITGFVTLLIAAGLGVAITRSITEPLGRLVEGSKALARGEFQHQVSVIGQDELAQLGQVFNATAGRLQNLYENLRKSEANLAEAQRLSHTGSWDWDVASKRIFWSAEMFNIFGFDPKTTTPTPENYLQSIHPDDRAPIDAAASELYKGNDAEYNYRIVLPDNSIRYVRTIAHAITNDSGQVIEFVGTVIDVTEQRNARKALEKAFEEIKTLKDQLYKENIALREEIDKVSMFEDIVGTSPALQAVLSRVSKVAPTDSTVLVTGETGTGKELVARAIHKRSHRSSRAFVSVNCAAIPRDLIASELFGHEKGAFTGATQQRLGRFELAEGGTIFLDEVGELPAVTQIALLRVLQEHEFERVGGTGSIQTNVRVIAATNRDLEASIAAGMFRSDLFYRLNVFPIEMPPLRERREDIPLLVGYFVDRFARRAGKHFQAISKKSLDLLQTYPWPGNIRELQNVIERSVVVCETESFAVDESWLSRPTLATEPVVQVELSGRLATQEKEIIEAALRECQGRVSGPTGAAAKLGVHRSTLESKISSLKINKSHFKNATASKNI